jgi:hypothetical protein
MRQIQAAVDQAEFLIKTQSLVDADGFDRESMLSAFTQSEREQVISLLTRLFFAQRRARNTRSTVSINTRPKCIWLLPPIAKTG